MNNILLITAIVFLGSPLGLCYWWAHALACVFAISQLHKLSSNYVFLILLALCAFATEPRFSLEYFLLASGFFAWSLGKKWLNTNENTRKWFFLCLFTIIFLFDMTEISFTERGSLFIWLAVFWQIFFNERSHKAYLVLTPFIFFSNKVSLMLAYLASLLSRFKRLAPWLIISIFSGLFFLLRLNLQGFYNKSLLPRLAIWQSCFNGFLEKPFFGHGYGTFAIDIPTYRITSWEIWGSKANQQISHGHSLWSHMLFEQGLLGISLFIILFVLIYKYCRKAFIPSLIISCCDASLVSFSQILLASLLLVPELKKTTLPSLEIAEKFKKTFKVLVLLIALVIFSTSSIAHYFYSQKNYDSAIRFDPFNSLYYLTRGYEKLNSDTIASEKDLRKAVSLSPHIGYFYGFLSAAQLANNKISEAKDSIEIALKYSGSNAYWKLLSSFINIDDQEKSRREFQEALQAEPELKELLVNQNYSANIFLGGKHRDSRVSSFYRRGPRLFLPLPYIETLPKFLQEKSEK